MADTREDSVYYEVLGENNAQGVLREIEGLENERKLLISRWIWELIQNARGIAGSQSALIISIERTDESLIFRHNGARFIKKEVAHLILYGSTKTDPKDIGKFGTGFITTHLLSRRVRVRAIMDTGASFDFWLDRSANTPAELEEQMRTSWNRFQESIDASTQPVSAPFTTEFYYPISCQVTEAVEGGIKSLHSAAPYLFAFNPMLRRLEIRDRGNVTIFEVVDGSLQTDGTLRSLRLRENDDDRTMVILSSADDAAAAIVVQMNADIPAIVPCKDVPRLFIAFPLNGMERFPIPAVVNSEEFYPLRDRDGIPLAAGSNEKNEANQKLFLRGCCRIVDLFVFAAAKGWSGIPVAARISGDENVRGAEPRWLKETVRAHVVERLRQVTILKSASGERLAPSNSWIPMATGRCLSSELWTLGNQLRSVRCKLPIEAEFQAWSDAATDWRRFAAPSEKDWSEFWTVRDLSAHLAKMGSLVTLQEDLGQTGSATKWLTEFYSRVEAAACTDLFPALSIVPNQRGELRSTVSLVRDGGIGDDLKGIADTLGISLRATLLDNAVVDHPVFRGLQIRTDEQVLNELLEHIKKIFKEPIAENLVAPNVSLFRALLNRGRFEKLDGFPVASAPGAQDKRSVIKLQAGTPQMRRWLAPVVTWPPRAQEYSQVFSEAVIIAAEYGENVSEKLWLDLVQRGFILRDPIFTTSKIVNCFMPDEPLPDDEKDIRTDRPYEQSNVAWGAVDEHSIFERARTSGGRSIALLRFFLDHALAVDPKGIEQTEGLCDNGKRHRFYRAEWLAPLKTRSWVSIGTKKTDAPTVSSFTTLLGAEAGILARLNEPQVAACFRAIGVAPSELLAGRVIMELRTAGQPLSVLAQVRAAVESLDPDLPLIDVRTLEEQIEKTLSSERIFAKLTSGFGIVALVLATVGIYGLMAYTVARRTEEIGIRMALGARVGQVLVGVLGEAIWMATVGVAVGVGTALWLARFIGAMLYGLTATDPATLLFTAALLTGATLAAGYGPARRASRIDPVRALRHE